MTWRSPLGPGIFPGGGEGYLLRHAGDGEFRGGEQFLRMMRAGSFAEWKAAMRMNARQTSNFTYADAAGNIFYVWNAALPAFPHPPAGDTTAIPVTRTAQVWTEYVPWDSLPQLLNPKGGYIHNENDPPHFTNLRQPLAPAKKKLTLEDVVRLKYSYRMLLADRVKADLLAAIGSAGGTGAAVAGG